MHEAHDTRTAARDTQRKKVYTWENECIQFMDNTYIPPSNVQPIVDYVWSEEGLIAPPSVVIKHNMRKNIATASRLHLSIQPMGLPTWVILHELSHSLTNEFDATKELYYSRAFEHSPHGPNFVGMYMKLLNKHMKIELPYLFFTAKKYNIEYNIHATHIFTD